MGQYYKPVLGNNEGTDQNVYSLKHGLKLMEHAWWFDNECACIARLLYKNPMRLAWVGDYAEKSDFEQSFKEDRCIPENVITVDLEKIWKSKKYDKSLDGEKLFLEGKYLVNHDQKTYVDLDFYHDSLDNNEGTINPIPLLTAVGNGRGGGDYCGNDNDSVGSWAWNLISIEDQEPEGFEKVNFFFEENY